MRETKEFRIKPNACNCSILCSVVIRYYVYIPPDVRETKEFRTKPSANYSVAFRIQPTPRKLFNGSIVCMFERFANVVSRVTRSLAPRSSLSLFGVGVRTVRALLAAGGFLRLV